MNHTPQVIAENLSTEEIQGLKSLFMNMDTDNSGTITYEELETGLARLGSKLTEAEVRQLMDVVRYIMLLIVNSLMQSCKITNERTMIFLSGGRGCKWVDRLC